MDSIATSNPIHVLVADSNQMQCQLLARALHRRPEFRVTSCSGEMEDILAALAQSPVEVAIMNADSSQSGWNDLTTLRRFQITHPQIAKLLLINARDRELVINAFRSGARGLFCFSDYPFRLLCKCIQSLHEGQIWVNNQQMQYLMEVIAQVPSLRVINSSGRKLLTPREEQVVALVADGLCNREVADELRLSEHTVKKYLYRIFDKVGVSSRVELVLYAVSNGGRLQAEWMAGAG